MITIIARTDPNQCCSELLTRNDRKILIHKTRRSRDFPDKPPTIKEAVACIAKLGGHLGRSATDRQAHSSSGEDGNVLST